MLKSQISYEQECNNVYTKVIIDISNFNTHKWICMVIKIEKTNGFLCFESEQTAEELNGVDHNFGQFSCISIRKAFFIRIMSSIRMQKS